MTESQLKAEIDALPRAPSPFLPGTNIQFAWDSTSLGWFKTCPRLYQYSMIEGWRSRSKSVHLDFGSFYHSALELYDRKIAEGAAHGEALEAAVRYCLEVTWVREEDWTGNKCPDCSGHGMKPDSDGEEIKCDACGGTGDEFSIKRSEPMDWGHNLKTRETLVRSVIWYLEQFGASDPAKTIILANGKPAVELSFRMEMDWGPTSYVEDDELKIVPGAIYEVEHYMYPNKQPYIISGHLDRVVEFNDGIYVMDRKTSSSTISPHYFEQYEPDNQMSLYTFAAKVIYQTPVRGVIIDAVQIAVGFSRYARGFTFRTDAQIEEWLEDTKRWLALAEQYAVAGFWPMNDRSCHHYGGCAFRKVCSKSPEVRNRFLKSDFIKHKWNPLQPR